MNILQILPELNFGGVEVGTCEVAEYLAARGHRAIVISAGGKLLRRLQAAGAKHYQLPVHDRSFLTMLRMVRRVRRIIEFEKIDIVHARSRVPAWIAFFATRGTSARFITTCHGYYATHFASRVMGWGRIVIAISEAVAHHMHEDFDVPRERIKIIHRGVDLEKFQFTLPSARKKEEFTVGIIGRLTPIKDHPNFIKAMARVVRQHPNVRIVIVGHTPEGREAYRQEIQTLVRRLGLTKHVVFLEGREDIPRIYSELDVMVLPTKTQEAFGRVIIEAQASGVCVIATRVGGIVDIIQDGINGLLVAPEDPPAIAEAVMRLAHDEKLRDTLARNAYEIVKAKFDIRHMLEETLAVYDTAMKVRKILVIKISAIGDVILAVPSLRALRQKFPEAHIALLTGIRVRPLVARCPYINELIICDFAGKDRGWWRLLRLGKALRAQDFDLVIDLQNNRRSHILAFLSLAPQRLGYHSGKLSFLLNIRVKPRKIFIPPVEHQFRLLEQLGIELKDPRLELWTSPEAERWVEHFLEEHWVAKEQILIGINPGASPRWLSKRWPVDRFASFIDTVSQRFHARVIVTGTRDEAYLIKKIEGMTRSKPIIAIGKTDLSQLISLIKRCTVFVTSDSAPLHLAASLNIPIVALFGPTEPKRHVPFSDQLKIIQKSMPCAPCYRPRCGSYACMRKITTDEVLAAVEELLKHKS